MEKEMRMCWEWQSVLLCMRQSGIKPTGKWLELLEKVKVKREVVGDRKEWFGSGMHRNGRHIRKEDIARFKMMPHMAMVRGTHGVLGKNDSYEHRMEWSVPSPSCATACGVNLCGPYLVGETGCSLYVTACVVVLWCYWVCVYLISGACTCCVDVLPRESGADNVWL